MAWKLLEGDCLKLMPEHIEDQTIDMILCDLPYGTTACKWDTVIPFKPLWREYERIIKPNGAIVLTASQPFTSALIMSNPKMYKYNWTWHKSRFSNQMLAKKQPLRVIEDICVFGYNPTYNPQGLIKYNKITKQGSKITDNIGGGSRDTEYLQEYTNYPLNLLEFKSESNTQHPTQKPVKLFEYLIKTYTNEGDLVLDNCAGSGTTGVACEITNRNSILIEQEPEYIQIIKDRLSDINMEQYTPQRTHKPLTAF